MIEVRIVVTFGNRQAVTGRGHEGTIVTQLCSLCENALNSTQKGLIFKIFWKAKNRERNRSVFMKILNIPFVLKKTIVLRNTLVHVGKEKRLDSPLKYKYDVKAKTPMC